MPRKPNRSGDHYNDPFPTHLRELIDEQNQKQDDLTEVLGVKSRQSVTGYIDGSTFPTADKIAAIAKAYHVSADWLLGLSDVRSPDADMQAACQFTGLSEYAICVLKLGKPVPHAINLLANPYTKQTFQEEWSALNSPLWKFASALVRLEHSAIPAIIKAVQNDPDMDYFEVVSKKEGVEVALYRFEKACRDIPPAVFFTDTALDELNSMEQKLYQKKYREFQNSQTEEAQHGEHTES